MLGNIDETRMSRTFKVKVQSFPEVKKEATFHYLVSLLEKMPGYVIHYVGTNDAIDF